MGNSQKVFGCCNVFSLAKGLTITEIVLVVVIIILGLIGGGGLDLNILVILIQIAYLVTEYIGIHKKNKCLIIFGCVIRVLEQILVIIFIILILLNIQEIGQDFQEIGVSAEESNTIR